MLQCFIAEVALLVPQITKFCKSTQLPIIIQFMESLHFPLRCPGNSMTHVKKLLLSWSRGKKEVQNFEIKKHSDKQQLNNNYYFFAVENNMWLSDSVRPAQEIPGTHYLSVMSSRIGSSLSLLSGLFQGSIAYSFTILNISQHLYHHAYQPLNTWLWHIKALWRSPDCHKNIANGESTLHLAMWFSLLPS